jgi:hypothetical protein
MMVMILVTLKAGAKHELFVAQQTGLWFINDIITFINIGELSIEQQRHY